MKPVIIIMILLVTLSLSSKESPYVGMETRQIKALSHEEIIKYLEGSGAGFALPAELNHYPGPRHVLDLIDELNLTEKQITATQKLYEKMNADAVELGEKLIRKERELDDFFAFKENDEGKLLRLLKQIESIRSELRFVHLHAHLKQTRILTPHQVMLYDQKRGYNSGNDEVDHSSMMNH
jgi:Spy/CpxP family protein refolding chaperone